MTEPYDGLKKLMQKNSLTFVANYSASKPFTQTKAEQSIPIVESELQPKRKGRRKTMVCYQCKTAFCSICKTCHTDSCNFIGLRVVTADDAWQYKDHTVRTQKARGFITLKEMGLTIPAPYGVIQCTEDVPHVVGEFRKKANSGTWFARPCPTRPRHGFEESRIVLGFQDGNGTQDELTAMFNRAVAADEKNQAEVLVIPYVESKYNAIITPNVIAVGPGNAGATAGVDSIAIPLMGVPFSGGELDEYYAKAGVDTSIDDPYFEVVYPENPYNYSHYFTQLRAGAKINGANSRDFVPQPVRVNAIIHADGDLLEWEKQVKTIEPGTVVVKIGGTMISHYGVHCLYNNVPCLTSRVPEIGEVLEPVGVKPNPDPQAVIRGLADGALVVVNNEHPMSKYLLATMVTLHNAGAMTGEDGYWLGFAASIMMRAGMAASHGEARHKISGMSHNRSKVYSLAFQNFHDARTTLGYANWMFKNLSWNSGYGGTKWGKCTDAIVELDNAIRKLLTIASQASLPDVAEMAVTEVVNKLNVALNQAHNNGWWLNKFTQQMEFELACQQKLQTIARVAPIMYEIKKMVADIDQQRRDDFITEWCYAAEIVEQAGKLFIQDEDSDVVTGDEEESESEPDENEDSDDSEEYVPQPKHSSSGHKSNSNGNYLFTGYEDVVAAQFKPVQLSNGKVFIHIQYKIDTDQLAEDDYFSTDTPDINVKTAQFPEWSKLSTSGSWGKTNQMYVPLTILPGQILKAPGIEIVYTMTDHEMSANAAVVYNDETPDEIKEEKSPEEIEVAAAAETDCPF